MAKGALSELGAPFISIDINEPSFPQDTTSSLNLTTITERIDWTRKRTVPQIFIGEDHIGGCDSLLVEMANGAFTDRLKKANIICTPVDAVAPNSPEATAIGPDLTAARLLKVGFPSSARCLNDPQSLSVAINPAPALDPVTLSVIIQRLALKLTDSHTTSDGSAIRYTAMLESDDMLEFRQLVTSLHSLSLVALGRLTDSQKMCFWANLYNALVFHSTAVIGPPADSPTARQAFFSGKSHPPLGLWSIGGLLFSMDDVEHGVLRCNALRDVPAEPTRVPYFETSPLKYTDSLPYCSALQLKPADARLQLLPSQLEPRIHFILNCGAKSCPPVRVLGQAAGCEDTGQSLDAVVETQLEQATSAYLEKEVSVEWTYSKGASFTDDTPGSNQQQRQSGKPINPIIRLPKILLWYGSDFGDNVVSVVERIAGMVGDEEVSGELRAAGSRGAAIVYGEYSWSQPLYR